MIIGHCLPGGRGYCSPERGLLVILFCVFLGHVVVLHAGGEAGTSSNKSRQAPNKVRFRSSGSSGAPHGAMVTAIPLAIGLSVALAQYQTSIAIAKPTASAIMKVIVIATVIATTPEQNTKDVPKFAT